MTEQSTAFEAYSYRVSARFGSRVQITIALHMHSQEDAQALARLLKREMARG